MKKFVFISSLLLFFFGCSKTELNPKITKVLKPFVTPESVLVTPSGDYYVSNIGVFGKDSDGTISKIVNGTVTTFVDGMNDPKGLAYKDGDIYAADKNQIWKVNSSAVKEIFVDSTAFPVVPKFLNDLVFDNAGNLYVSETGNFDSTDGAIYKITPDAKVSVFIDHIASPEICSPNGLLFDKDNNLLVIDLHTGKLLKVDPEGKSVTVINSDAKMGDGIAYDNEGNLYFSDWHGGRIFRMDKQNNVKVIMDSLKAPADINIDKTKDLLLIPEFQGNQVDEVTLY